MQSHDHDQPFFHRPARNRDFRKAIPNHSNLVVIHRAVPLIPNSWA
jgi:hypothetical protein